MLLHVLNAVFLLAILAVIILLIVNNGCGRFHPKPPGEAEVDVPAVFAFVNELNVLTNIMIAVPGLMLLVLGFPLEGALVLLCAVMSILWHASGTRVFAVLDYICAALALFVMVCVFLRIVQVRGLPELSPFWLIIPIAAFLAFGGVRQHDDTSYLQSRIAHALWHVLGGVVFLMIVQELLRAPSLLPSRDLRAAIRLTDARMRRRARRYPRSWSLVVGLFRDLFRVTTTNG